MIVTHNGITYMDQDAVDQLSKNDEGKKKLARIGTYEKLQWHTCSVYDPASKKMVPKVMINPVGMPNRASRRKKIDLKAGYMKNNFEHRTQHKRF